LIDLPGLNSFDAIAADPAVSENGRYIVFSASRQGRLGIFLYDRELRSLRNLTGNLQAEVRNPLVLMAVRLPLSRVRMGSGIF